MKRVLVVFLEGTKKNVLMESVSFLKEKLNFEVMPLYIKDVRKDDVIPATMNGMILNMNTNSFSEERDELETREIEKLRADLKSIGIMKELKVEFGFPWEIIKENLKLADILVLEKGEILSEVVVTALKNQFKPILLIGEKSLTQIEKICISSDDGVKVNKSVSNFINLFSEIKTYDMLTINYEIEDNKLKQYMEDKGKVVNYKEYKGEEAKDSYLSDIGKYDLLIMGNLSRGYFFEKITNKKGLNIMEKSKISIFVG